MYYPNNIYKFQQDDGGNTQKWTDLDQALRTKRSTSGFLLVADAILDCENGASSFLPGRRVDLGGPFELQAEYLGTQVSFDGCTFFGFRFDKVGAFAVVIWLEDDCARYASVRRGDEDTQHAASKHLEQHGAHLVTNVIDAEHGAGRT